MPEGENLKLVTLPCNAIEEKAPDPRQEHAAHALEPLTARRASDARLTGEEVKRPDEIFRKSFRTTLAVLPPPVVRFFDLSGRGLPEDDGETLLSHRRSR